MPSLRSLLLAGALAAIPAAMAAEELPSSTLDAAAAEREQDGADFAQLLDQVDPSALHAALHNLSPDKFKHGAFHEDRKAAQVIHHEDPPLATKIVGLARRQDNANGSTPVS